MSLLILKILIIEFLVGAVLAAWQRDFPMALYYGSAAALNFAILIK